jgi:hypothetical protein
MANSSQLSDFSSTIVISSEPNAPESLQRIGSSGQFFKWTDDCNYEFMEWWATTTWYQENEALPKPIKINWNSNIRKSAKWDDFDQGAHKLSGYPHIICHHCSRQLEHPDYKATGTSALGKHTRSDKCRKKSSRQSKGLVQSTLVRRATAIQVSFDTYNNYYATVLKNLGDTSNVLCQ